MGNTIGNLSRQVLIEHVCCSWIKCIAYFVYFILAISPDAKIILPILAGLVQVFLSHNAERCIDSVIFFVSLGSLVIGLFSVHQIF